MEIVFSHPSYLWFLLSIPILIITHFLSIKYTSKKALKFANFPAIEKVTGDKLVTKNLSILITRSVILLLAILAASGSILWYTTLTSSSDYVIAIDASSSMLADDYSPDRLEAAKSSALLFLDSIPSNTNVGIISFAGTSFVDSQLTNQRSSVRQAISDIQAKRIGGTDIGEAIVTASNLLSASKNAKVIILLTDGRTNVGETIGDAISYANTNKVTINTIGIGTVSGGNIGNDITLTLDEETLKRISEETSGTYALARNNNELAEAYKGMAELTNKKVPFNLSILSLVLAIILLLVEWGLINTRFKILP